MVDLMVREQQSARAAGENVPVGFKVTEVGVIPTDWDVYSLGELSISIASGKTYTQSNGEYPLYGSTGLIGTCEFGEYEGNALLIARVGANAGRLNFVSGKYGVSDNTLIVKLKPQHNIALFYYILLQKNLNTLIFGSGQPLITGSLLKKIIIAIPCKDEQTSIANVLTEVDVLIINLEKLIIKKQAIKTATMQQLLTGKTRLPQFALRENGTVKGYKKSELGEIPEDWTIEHFSKLATLRNERVNPKTKNIENFCVELEHIVPEFGQLNGFTETSSSSSIKNFFSENDILFGKLRSYLKKYWKATRSGVCSTEIWVLKAELHKAIPEFIFQTVRTDRFIQTASEAYGTHMPRADWKIIREFLVATPSKEEQIAIATILSDMDKDIQALQQRLDKTRQLKQGMMQELLTGKTRLI